MFVRFRSTSRRLQVSLIATGRLAGRVRHEHIASLGSIPLTHSPAERIAFWTHLHARLAKLANRIDSSAQGPILAAIHARIPMPTLDDQQAVRLEHAQANAQFWQGAADWAAEDIEGHKQLLAATQRAIAEREKVSADFATHAQAAKERLAQVENGETVAGMTPLTRKDVIRITGWTETEVRHCERVAEIADRVGPEPLLDELKRRTALAEKAVVRRLHRKLALHD
jgi:hypothetical protein